MKRIYTGRLLLPLLLLAWSLTATAAERTVYLVNDALGSPVAAMDEQGAVLWRENYAPYGERRIKSPENPAHPAYTGKSEDADTGFVYMGARMYDPETARFTGIDPVNFREANTQSFNRYFYGNNSPYVFIDPDGREEKEFDVSVKAEELANQNRDFHNGGFATKAQAELNDAGEMAGEEAVWMTVGAALKAVGIIGRKVANTEAKAFHHTVDASVDSITRSGLRPGSYATPTAGLSPLQAHIELALNPVGGARNSVLQIDLAGLRKAGYKIPAATRVTGQFGMAGGGYEMRFPYAIPPEFLKVLEK